MADTDLLRDPEQLRQDAGVLDAWADCVGGTRLDIVRRAAAALREVSELREAVYRMDQMQKSYYEDVLTRRLATG